MSPVVVFFIVCFISSSSCLLPLSIGISVAISAALMTGAIVGRTFFVDNFSFISDTTTTATRTQDCAMKDKFRANFHIILPVKTTIFIFIGYTV